MFGVSTDAHPFHWFCTTGLQINDIEPFCQDEIAMYKQCAERRVSFNPFV